MSFNIPPLEDSQFYISLSFRRASKYKSPIKKAELVKEVLLERLNQIKLDFPKVEDFEDFYYELFTTLIDQDEYQIALYKLRKTIEQIKLISGKYIGEIKRTEEQKALGSYYGRLASIMSSLDKTLIYLNKVRKELKDFPKLRKNHKIVAIAGFPNVGKSTLLTKISTSKPEINSYAFTTKRLNIGYIPNEKIQLIDTPGTLNRKKMNFIEKQADLLIKQKADLIVYVFDLTEASYPYESQKKHYQEIKKLNKPMLIYFSKSDLQDLKKLKQTQCRYKNSFYDSELIAKAIINS